ncbi:MAG: radical SAM protein [Rhodocyclales bacterium]|nr:radical SAM protein [Rhodocyclales bacterium]
MPDHTLSIENHSRDSAGMRYVYPVVSRRAGGVSIGINLNPNNACNWRCIYCQVPGLVRGGAPALDLALLEFELDRFLGWAINGDLMLKHVPEGARRLVDLAFSGNGEPTSADEFDLAVELVVRCLHAHGQGGKLPVRLITNGSLLDRKHVQAGISRIGRGGGEVWFKVDTATGPGLARINGSRIRPESVQRRLIRCTELAPTWVQTCLFSVDGKPPDEAELQSYLHLLEPVAPRLAGVHLYGLARPSMQAEAPRLGRLDATWLDAFATRLLRCGLRVHVSP